jgi:hypothetical protein
LSGGQSTPKNDKEYDNSNSDGDDNNHQKYEDEEDRLFDANADFLSFDDIGKHK